MRLRSALLLGLVIASAVIACAKADEPRAPAPAASGASAIVLDAADGEVDASGALRALPMPQQFPRVTLDAAMFDGSRDAAKR